MRPMIPAYLPDFTCSYLIEEPENGIHPSSFVLHRPTKEPPTLSWAVIIRHSENGVMKPIFRSCLLPGFWDEQ